MPRKTCDQCSPSTINGVFCHEKGCPNDKKVWEDGEWIKYYECFNCGFELREGEICDCKEEDFS